MVFSLPELRTRTLRNNLVWLRSFGCAIRRAHRGLRVSHPELPEYCAWLLDSPDPDPHERIRMVLAEVRSESSAPDLCIETFEPDALLESLLREAGYERGLASVTKAAIWSPDMVPASPRITRVARQRISDWSALYSEGFGRTGESRELDRTRWQRAAAQPKLRFWFIEQANQPIGVCQTCHDCGVVGIYSFTLVPAHRGRSSVRACMNALRAQLTARGEVTVYFERVKPPRRFVQSSSLISALPAPVRNWQTYRHTGVAPTPCPGN